MNEGSLPLHLSESVHGQVHVGSLGVHVLPPSDDLRQTMLIGWNALRSPMLSRRASHTATRSPFGAVQSAGMRYTAIPPSPFFHSTVFSPARQVAAAKTNIVTIFFIEFSFSSCGDCCLIVLRPRFALEC